MVAFSGVADGAVEAEAAERAGSEAAGSEAGDAEVGGAATVCGDPGETGGGVRAAHPEARTTPAANRNALDATRISFRTCHEPLRSAFIGPSLLHADAVAHDEPMETITYPVRIDAVVAWGEMDAFQHVNNTVYLRWIESARIEYFRRVGLLARMERERVGPILARTEIDYRLPVTWPDTVHIEVGVEKLGRSSFVMAYRMTSDAKSGAIVAEAKTIIVNFDYTRGASVPIDDELRSRIAALGASC
jgi:acyl-CoA thioester hydrolase